MALPRQVGQIAVEIGVHRTRQMPRRVLRGAGLRVGQRETRVHQPRGGAGRGARVEQARGCRGKGGGKPDLAQGGGQDATKIGDALAAIERAVADRG